MRILFIMIMLCAGLLFGFLSTASAAGAHIFNGNSKTDYIVGIRYFLFGLVSGELERCVKSGQTHHFKRSVVGSLGQVCVEKAPQGCDKIPESRRSRITISCTDTYKIPGVWLPWRNFKVDINEAGGWVVTEK